MLTTTPSTRNCTDCTAVSSAAVACRVTVPETVAPAAGAVTDTVGDVVSLLTVTLTSALVVLWLSPAVATALRVWDPLALVVVDHVAL